MQFHLLSFEGPDPYARAGGLASRVEGLASALAGLGFETHLWFVGDPAAPGHEARGRLVLHRWCQWLSAGCPAGVYQGEDAKCEDYARSLPPWLWAHHLRRHLEAGGRAVVLAEEWQTAKALVHLDALARDAGRRDRVTLLWNANNTFGFHRIPWRALGSAAVITTVSRYMKGCLLSLGVDSIVVPNGLSADAFDPPDGRAVAELRRRFRDRAVLVKMARFDPDKRWLLAVHTVAELKRQGWRPLLVARGGSEPHGADVLATARALGLRVAARRAPAPGVEGLLAALHHVDAADVVQLESFVDPAARRTLFRAADTVLANSGHEPFGLVGLEAMAAGGLACTGGSGEDYALAGRNARVLQSGDPREFVGLYRRLRERPAEARRIRRAGRATARSYAWNEVLRHEVLPRVDIDHAAARAEIPPAADPRSFT